MHTGAILKAARSSQDTHEAGLFYVELMKEVRKGDILLGDRHYCTFVNAATLLGKGADMLMRLNGSRRWPKETKGGDVVVDWIRPRTSDRPKHMEAEEWEGLSESIPVRYVRVRVQHFRWSIVRTLSRSMSPREVILLEGIEKAKHGNRARGLNGN